MSVSSLPSMAGSVSSLPSMAGSASSLPSMAGSVSSLPPGTIPQPPLSIISRITATVTWTETILAVRSITDVTTVAAVWASEVGTVQALTDITTVSAAWSEQITAVRALTDITTVAATIGETAIVAHAVTDVTTVDVVWSQIVVPAIAITDVTTVAAAYSEQVSAIRAITDVTTVGVTYSEVVEAQGGGRTLTDVTTVGVTWSEQVIAAVDLDDLTTATIAWSQTVVPALPVTDLTSVTATISQAVIAVRAVTDVTTAAAAWSEQVTAVRTITDTTTVEATWSEQVAAIRAAFVASASATGTSLTLPTHQAGDLIVMCAGARTNSASREITLPAGWTSIRSATFDGYRFSTLRVAYKVAASGGETSGTWTYAGGLTALVYRGLSVGASAITANASFSQGPVARPTLAVGSGWALQLAVCTSGTGTPGVGDPTTAPDTLRGSTTITTSPNRAVVAVWDSDGPVGGTVATSSQTFTSSGNRSTDGWGTVVVELAPT